MIIDWNKLLSHFHFGKTRLIETVYNFIGYSFVRWYIFLLFFINLINWLLVYYFNKNVSQSLVVLHYNVNLGVNLIGQPNSLYIIPTLGLGLIIINFFLLLNLYRKNGFIIHLVFGFSLLMNFFLIAGSTSIYLINFR